MKQKELNSHKHKINRLLLGKNCNVINHDNSLKIIFDLNCFEYYN